LDFATRIVSVSDEQGGGERERERENLHKLCLRIGEGQDEINEFGGSIIVKISEEILLGENNAQSSGLLHSSLGIDGLVFDTTNLKELGEKLKVVSGPT
jgi:hypothetical protein